MQLPPGAPPVVGRDAIAQAIQGAYQAFDYQDFEIAVDEAVVSGDLGYARGTYTARQVPRDGGDAIEIDGKYMTIFRQNDDGNWRIYRDAFNSNE